MSKPVKVVIWIIGVVAVVLVAATIAIKLYLTKERILAWVTPPVEEQLNRQVRIDDAGAGLGGIYLAGLDVRAADAPEPLVAAERIQVDWNLWSLLSGTVEIEDVRLIRPRIHVTRLPDGSLDIDDILAPRQEGPSDQAPTPPAAEPAAAGPPVEVVVALFSMEGGQIAFEDRTRTPARTYVLDAIDSRITNLSLDGPIQYSLQANLPFSPAGRFSAVGTLNAATRALTARLQVDDFELASLNELVAEGTQFATGRFGLDLDAELSDAGASLAGSLGIEGLVLRAGDARGEPTDVRVELNASADLSQDRATLSELRLTAAEQVLRLTAEASRLSGRPQIQFTLESAALNADPLLALLPPAPEGGGKPPPAGAAPATPAEPAPVPVDAAGDVRIESLTAGGLTVEGFTSRIELRDGVLQIDPTAARIYGGTLGATAEADLEQIGPPFSATTQLTGTRLGDLLGALSPKLDQTVTGLVDVNLEASGAGGDLELLTADLKAQAKDGKIVDHPLARQFSQLFKVKEFETLNFYDLRLDAGASGGVGTVRSLVLNGPNLQATGTGTVGLLDQELDLRLAVALPRNIAAKLLSERTTLDAVTDAEGWSRLPLRLRGTTQEPRYGLDTEALAKIAAKALGGKAREAVEGKVLDKLPVGEAEKKGLREGVRKLFGE